MLRNLDCDTDRLYLIINHRKNDIDFEVLYPIIPDYFWSCADGRQLRSEIDSRLLANFKQYLEQEPTYRSYRESGGNQGMYSSSLNSS